jgi:hypothetical protein
MRYHLPVQQLLMFTGLLPLKATYLQLNNRCQGYDVICKNAKLRCSYMRRQRFVHE